MRTGLTRISLTILAFVLVVGFSFASNSHIAHAQDATPEMTEMAKVVCDADLILSLYTAENSFGFAAVVDKMMADPAMASMVTIHLDGYDEGQFAPLFTSMMSMMSSNMSMPNSMMTDDMMKGVTAMMSMSMDDMEKQMMAAMPAGSDATAMTTLVPATIAGEPAECTALRDELRQFYIAIAATGMMMPATTK